MEERMWRMVAPETCGYTWAGTYKKRLLDGSFEEEAVYHNCSRQPHPTIGGDHRCDCDEEIGPKQTVQENGARNE